MYDCVVGPVAGEVDAMADVVAPISVVASVVGCVLATSEFNLTLHVKYKLLGPDGKALGPTGDVSGTTSFFVSTSSVVSSKQVLGDVTTDERQALPLAAEELAKRLVTQLSEGW